jgi:hypothetical protein
MVDGPSRGEPERKFRSASFFWRLEENRNNPLIATPKFKPSTKPIATHHIQSTQGLLAALAARTRRRSARANSLLQPSIRRRVLQVNALASLQDGRLPPCAAGNRVGSDDTAVAQGRSFNGLDLASTSRRFGVACSR